MPHRERRKALEAPCDASDGERAEDVSTDPELRLGDVTIVEPEDFRRPDARRRWAELIRMIYEVDPLMCPKCGGEMHVIALILSRR